MAATGYTPIYLYYSSTATNQPSAGNLGYGELAINITDGYLFYKDNANAIQKIGYKLVPTTAGGTGLTSFTTGGVMYASSTSALATGTSLYFDGSNSVGLGTNSPSTYQAGTVGLAVRGAYPSIALSGTEASARNWLLYESGGNLRVYDVTAGLVRSSWDSSGNYFVTNGYASATSFIPIGSVVPTNGMYLPAANTVGFATNSAQAMQISSAGGVSIGNTTDPGAGSLNVNASALIGNASNYGVSAASGSVFTKKYIVWAADNTGSASNRNWNAGVNEYAAGSWQLTSSSANNNWPNDAYRFAVTIAGSCYNTTGTYGTLSDVNFKENIENARSYIDDLCKLRVVKYSLKEENSDKATKLGLIAQEVEQVFPNMVEIGSTPEGDEFKSIKMSVLIPMLLTAVQELAVEIATLKGQNNVAN